MAESYIRTAGDCLEQAHTSLEKKNYPLSVRRSQECIELSLKAALRSIGLEYPREHEVSRALEMTGKKFPSWFSVKIPKFMEISKDLSKKRGPAMYGYELELKPASAIFKKEDAEEALSSAKSVFQACEKLLNEMWG
jgi:HEPN domain-containing protein